MRINGYELRVTIAAYDGCHKIYIPVEGQEELFIQDMKGKGWSYPDDFFKIDCVSNLWDMYQSSCSLRFIQQINFCDGEEKYLDIIPQFAFCDNEGFFDECSAREAFEF